MHVRLLWPVADVDECRDGTHQCRYNQICENTRGSYHCTCPRGYRSQGVGRPCVGTCLCLELNPVRYNIKPSLLLCHSDYFGLLSQA